MGGVRRDVATLGPGWAPELEWYAKAVRAMQEQKPEVRTSWRYLGAIHGFNPKLWRDLDIIGPADPLPAQAEWNGRMWSQCQHQGWYFLPWHRAYLAAFEAIVARTIEGLNGPPGWTLPYWNYLDAGNSTARDIPWAFLQPKLPDGSDNPLAATPRSGITALGPQPGVPDISLKSMDVHRFTSAPRTVGFGGADTDGFNHVEGQNGALEGNPHNNVHVMIGGFGGGYMADPDLAGLDPIFWIHHCNIDRLWAAWLTSPRNVQENGKPWSDGPSPRVFEMPDADGGLVAFTPGETLPGRKLAPNYDDLENGTGIGGAAIAAVDDGSQGVTAMPAKLSDEAPAEATLVGANAGLVTVGPGTVATEVRLQPQQADIAGDPVEQRVFLNLENVRGTAPSGALSVRIGAPAQGAAPASAPEEVESVALFGLGKASSATGSHGGNGISVAIDITDLAKRIAQRTGSVPDQLVVHLEQPADGQPDITVGRVSLYKQPVR